MALGKIPQEILDEVVSRTDLVHLVSQHVSLKKSGKDYKGLCPFHSEKSPSFMVSPEKGIFHCFGCGAGGNAFRFLMLHDRITFPEAVKKLALEAGVTLNSLSDPKEVQVYKDRELLYKINRYAAWFYSEQLSSRSNNPAKKHLAERLITDESARDFKLGYAPAEWDSLVTFFQSKNIPLEKAALLGLVRLGKTGNYYDFFRNRLVFPIIDAEDRVLGFSARKLDEADPAGKYINSPESPIYHKGEVVYGLSQSREYIRKSNKVILVEGNVDLIRLYQSGFKNVVAPLGTSLTPMQIKLLRRFCDDFFIMFDGDAAGFKASLRALDIFLKEGILPHFVALNEGEDPDTFVKDRGSAALSNLIGVSKPFIEWLLENELSQSGLRTDSRVKAAGKIGSYIDLLPEGVLKNAYRARIDQFIGVESNEKKASQQSIDQGFQRVEKKMTKSKNSLERILLQFYLRFPNLVAGLFSREIFENFENSDLKILGLKLISNHETSGQSVSINVSGASENFDSILSELLLEPLLVKDEEILPLVTDALKNWQRHRVKEQLRELTRKIHVAELNKDTELMSLLMQQKTALTSSVKSFSIGE